jgi:hypothetical protein
MSLTGRIRDGGVVLDSPAALPNGTLVRIEPIDGPVPVKDMRPSLLERMKDVVGIADGLPDDAALNVDHYLYGHPKK